MVSIMFVSLLLFGGINPASLDGFREDYMRGVQAFRDGDMETFYSAMQSAYQQNPHHVGVRFNFAIANAQTERLDVALEILRGLAKSGLVVPLDSKWLDPLREQPKLAEELKAVEDLFAANRSPMLKAEVAYELPRKDFFAEGIAFDPRTKALFVGSVHHREIVRFAEDGTVSTFIKSGEHGLMSVLGMTLDPIKRLLWVCSSGMKQSKDLDASKHETAELLAFNLETGEIANRVSVPKAEGNNLNDVVRHKDGTLFFSDATSGAIYRLTDSAQQLELLLDHGTFRSPQGLALNVNGTELYIADYSHGLFKLNLKTKELTHLKVPEGAVLAGIDGLVAHHDQLIAIQNGVRPHRVLRLKLKDRNTAIERVTVLERSHPKFDEPTLGLIRGDQLLLVAASQWPHYDRDGKPLSSDALRQPEILAIPLSE